MMNTTILALVPLAGVAARFTTATLALDLGTTTGFAVRNTSGLISSGTV